MSQSWDYIAKLVCIGDSGTGKSSLSVRLCEGRFVNWHDVTIGVEYSSTVVPVGPPASHALNIPNPHDKPAKVAKTKLRSSPSSPVSKPASSSKTSAASQATSAAGETQKHMKLSLWDTAGQETYKSITRSYFRGASGALLVFDITRRATFESVTGWLHDLRQIAEEGIVVVLVGNKSDLTSSSLVEDSSNSSATNDAGAASSASTGHPNSSSPTTATAAAATTLSRSGSPAPNAAPVATGKKNRREVTRAEAEAWCAANNVMQYVETSAKSGDNVERAFLEVAERIFQNVEAGKYDLNDRRSGVKGPGAGGSSGGARRGAGGEVVLGVNDVGGMRAGKSGWTGGCC